jgi:hypothetical protein
MRTLDLQHPAAWWRQWRTDHPVTFRRAETRSVVIVSSVASILVAALFVLAQFGILSGY